MKNKKVIIFSTLSFAIFGNTAHAGKSIKAHINDYYGVMNQSNHCRYVADDNGKSYCFTLQKAKKVTSKYGDRLYVLMQGDLPEAGHVHSGLLGMFVFAPSKTGKWRVVSANSKITAGSGWGKAPTDCSFHQFAPSKWGFLCHGGYAGQGYVHGFYQILTPSESNILKSNIVSYADDSGTGNPKTNLDSKIKINKNIIIKGFYPLTVTVSGKDGNKRYKNRKYRISYRKNKGYVIPKGYPLRAW